jgi:hypothetical protein
MKIIVTERQYELLSETFSMDRLKRRITKEFFGKYILDMVADFPMLCEDFGDEYQYSDSIIAMAIEHFFAVNEDYFPEGSYEEFIDIIFPLCQNWYGEDLIKNYVLTCKE